MSATALELTLLLLAAGIVLGYSNWRQVRLNRSLTQALARLSEANERLYKNATYDDLTGLYNRSTFQALLEAEITAQQADARPFCLLWLDLDRFKPINDTYGHQVGDEVLRQVARRISAILRLSDTCARLGGDEFTILLRHCDGDAAATIAAAIATSISSPILVQGQSLEVSASIGIATSSDNFATCDEWLSAADGAMYLAKRGDRPYHFHDELIQRQVVERQAIERALQGAIARDEFEMYYQPIISLSTGQAVGVEALVRWHYPSGELYTPGRFLAIAEGKPEQIKKLCNHLIGLVCQQLLAWDDQGISPSLFVAVNVTPTSFCSADFARRIEAILGRYQIDRYRLHLEITEQAAMPLDFSPDSPEYAVLQSLISSLGLRIALDDFGTGYSSMARLGAFPKDATLKIDRQFIDSLFRADSSSPTIVQAIVRLGHALGMAIVAEGVETAEQLQFLQGIGCDCGQGYYWSRPFPAEKLADFLER